VIGLRRKHRIVVIDAMVPMILTQDEARALLSHEIAHHLNHDCLRHRVLCFLARIALLGDGYVAALEYSYGIESKADETAVHRFKVKPADLSECIQKLAAFSAIDAIRRGGGLSIQEVVDSNRMDTDIANQRVSIREETQIWWRCYTCDTRMGY